MSDSSKRVGLSSFLGAGAVSLPSFGIRVLFLAGFSVEFSSAAGSGVTDISAVAVCFLRISSIKSLLRKSPALSTPFAFANSRSSAVSFSVSSVLLNIYILSRILFLSLTK
ncbi:hypothetical protein D3C85_1104930 [compost metagenome]